MKDDKRFKKLKVIFIDWHCTLCSCTLFHELQHKDYMLFDKLDNRLFEELDPKLFEKWMRGDLNKEQVVKMLAADDLDAAKIGQLLKENCEKMHFDRKDFLNWVKKIRKKGRRVVIATDNIDTFCDYTVPALKLDRHFDDIISSYNIKHLKEDIDGKKMMFFDSYLKSHNITYDEAILIDDSRRIEAKCKKCGMQSKRVTCPEDVLKILMLIDKNCE